jgi:hypothetical protein
MSILISNSKTIVPILLCIVILASAYGCAAIKTNSGSAADIRDSSGAADAESTNQAPGGISLDFSTAIDSEKSYDAWLREIKPLAAADIQEIWVEKTVCGCRVLFYLGKDQCSYVGAETPAGLFELFVIDNAPLNPPAYYYTYEAQEYENTLGANGFKVQLTIGLTFELTAYYILEDGRPIIHAYANRAIETDLDDDGDLEVISTYPSMPPTCVLIKNFNGALKWSGDIKGILSANYGVEFEEDTKTFSAYWYEGDDKDFGISSDNVMHKSYAYYGEGLIICAT